MTRSSEELLALADIYERVAIEYATHGISNMSYAERADRKFRIAAALRSLATKDSADGQRDNRGDRAGDKEGEIMRCDQCRHWKDDAQSGWEYRFSGFRLCTAVRMRSEVLDEATNGLGIGWADGEDDWDVYGDKPPPPNSWTGVRAAALKKARAVVQDGSDYMAEMLTAPDFFCALFAPSSSGRTSAFEADSLGSNPSGASEPPE